MSRPIKKTLWLVLIAFSVLAIMSGPAPGEVDMPSEITIDYVENKFKPVNFDHEMHLDIAETCGECHHIHDDERNSTCNDCHALDSDAFKAAAEDGFPPCSGCHEYYSPEEPEMPSLKVALHKTCFKCHVGMGELGLSPGGCVETCHGR